MRLIVITGVSQSLGLAMTKQFIQLEHTVLGCVRNLVVVELEQKFGLPHNFTAVDVSNEQQVQAWPEYLLTDTRHLPDKGGRRLDRVLFDTSDTSLNWSRNRRWQFIKSA